MTYRLRRRLYIAGWVLVLALYGIAEVAPARGWPDWVEPGASMGVVLLFVVLALIYLLTKEPPEEAVLAEMDIDVRSAAPLQLSRTTHEGAAAGLLALMSGISEEYWSAGWMGDLERECWRARETGGFAYGHGTITERQVMLLRLLSEEAGGWWHWAEGDDDPSFVTLDEWRAIVASEAGGDPKVSAGA